MIQYVILLIVPVVLGALIAAAILAFNGLRERSERSRWELGEARSLDRTPFRTDVTHGPTGDREDQRIAS
jgi:hypothetical protein